METLEFARRFAERRPARQTDHPRSPGVVVLEFGGGNCNKAGERSCRDFCAVPNGKVYNPFLDPSVDMLLDFFPKVAQLQPAVVSIVPNGEGVETIQKSNTKWSKVEELDAQGYLTPEQYRALSEYHHGKYKTPLIKRGKPMTPAEKMAVTLALGKNAGLNLSLTSNGTYLTRELFELYGKMGLQLINLSYHPNKPFDPQRYNPDLEHLIARADDAIDAGVIPTITHVLTSQNADTFVALSDYVTAHDVLFAVGIANARGGSFSTDKTSIEPTDAQLKMVFRRLLARKLFADRHIRTTLPYLLAAPYLKRWVCDQTTDFLHLSIEPVNGKLQPKLNVCSEVRPEDGAKIEDFLSDGKLQTSEYLAWRAHAMKDPDHGCPSCTHQCYFKAETRGGIDLSDALEAHDYWDTTGKALRQRHTFRHPIRPVVSQRSILQTPYAWESLLQGVTRQMVKLAGDEYWQNTFRRSGVKYADVIAACIEDASDPAVITELVEAEKKDAKLPLWNIKTAPDGKKLPPVVTGFYEDWHDEDNWQSRLLRLLYLQFQASGKEAGYATPLKFADLLRHQSPHDFEKGIEAIVYEQTVGKNHMLAFKGDIFPFIARLFLSKVNIFSLKLKRNQDVDSVSFIYWLIHSSWLSVFHLPNLKR